MKSKEMFEVDREGDVEITFIGHGTLMLSWGETVIHVDPVGEYADYQEMPGASLVLVSHQHGDHLDVSAVGAVRRGGTVVIAPPICSEHLDGARILGNGQTTSAHGVEVEAVPAYNIRHTRDGRTPFHPRGEGNGYILTLGEKRLYLAGDTENIPEMRDFGRVDIAFLPMNLPYTMTPEMAAEAARMLQAGIVYPYHFVETETSRLVELLADLPEVEVRVRAMA